ncbi:hypothetical protein [Streptomyces sp. V4I2]|uniref:hypothetical protein n=1 Tax=Streptomyces sp. V4I2 TaxID=3042280 RepID=UPI00277D4C20|nr:hypothetical protein [Streptomyces sp. V4I2]
MVTVLTDVRRAQRITERVPDPELPMLTLADLGVLRDVEVGEDGTVVVSPPRPTPAARPRPRSALSTPPSRATRKRPAGTTHRPVPNGVKSFTDPLTVRANLTGLGYYVQLPGLLADQADDQLRTAYTAAAGAAGVSSLTQLRTVGRGRLCARRPEAQNKRVPVGDIDPWIKLLSMMNDPNFGTDRRLRGFVTHTLAAFTALPTK